MKMFYVRDKSLGSTYMPTHTPAAIDPLNCIGRFWLGPVGSASKLISNCTQMNYEMNCITMHRCTKICYNVLQRTPNGPSTLASASLVAVTVKGNCASQLVRMKRDAVFSVVCDLYHNTGSVQFGCFCQPIRDLCKLTVRSDICKHGLMRMWIVGSQFSYSLYIFHFLQMFLN